MEYDPNTWGPSEVDQKVAPAGRLAEPDCAVVTRVGNVFMKIEIFADADTVAQQAAAIHRRRGSSGGCSPRTLYLGRQWRAYPMGHAPRVCRRGGSLG